MADRAAPPVVVDREWIDHLLDRLLEDGFTVLGPTVRDGVISLAPVSSTSDFPIGVTDEQGPGSYRLGVGDDERLFGWAVGPTSPKATFHPSRAIVWSGTSDFQPADPAPEAPPKALVGIRPCELAAIERLDRVLMETGVVDPPYAGERRGAFIAVVNCGEPSGTCFCASMGTGPRARGAYDLAITELTEGGHRFLIEPGSGRGIEMLALLGGRPATGDDVDEAARVVDGASRHMGRSLDTSGIRESLYAEAESPHWEDVGGRCLTCGNCTMVCPTCFCSTVDERRDLTTGVVQRVRRWDSCFSLEFTLVHGGPHRIAPGARYRQWITHKLASWHDQFGSSGCVGCGRCITWCPVGIDITAEIAALRDREVPIAQS